MYSQLSPALSERSIRCDAIGYQPEATEFPLLPFITLSGLSRPLKAPRKVSLSVSNPLI